MKRRIAFVLCLVLAAMLTGCSLDPLAGYVTTQPPETPTYQPVSPSAVGVVSDRQTVTLYFEYQDSGMLSTESRVISVSMDKRVEQSVIEELISGPSADHSELAAVMSADVRVMSVEEREGVLFVTLSGEFLDTPGDAPADWEGDEYWAREIPERRLTALNSIVCAVTDLGQYDSVQLLIDRDGDGERTGERVQRYYFYADAPRDMNVLLDVARRDEDVVLTPRNTLATALSALQGKSWDALYQYIAPQCGDSVRPLHDDFVSAMQTRACTLVSFEVGDAMVSNDGQSATVCVDAQITFKDGSARGESAFPMLLGRDGEVWKISYASLIGLLEG